MTLGPGSRLDQYEIISPLGAGGMGEVYRARDTRLARDVAIKVLPERLASDPEALGRFEREAKALAALSHPNILTIFDFGTDNSVTYAVMELLEGETLRKKILRGQVPTNKMIEIGSAITEGLAAAHSRSIIHRDLKPENIFLTSGGGVKILDFGLARLDHSPPLQGESRMATVSGTQPGTILGTIGYMSPEQVRGQSLDTRTDIFSLGCILYEMSTGKCPFARNTAADTMAAILNHNPPDLAATASEIPPEMDRLILHCLEKNPDDRFQSARDLSFDLKEIASGVRFTKPIQRNQARRFPFEKMLIAGFVLCFALAGLWWFGRIGGGASDPSIRIPVAVADFINETGERDLDGLSGMLITSLEQSKKLSVMTRSRMFDLTKQMGQENPEKIDEHLGREICKRANVNALILASIRKFDQLYTIDLKVLDPEKNEYLFTTKQEGKGKSSVPEMIDQLSEQTRRGLNEKATEIQSSSRKVIDVTTSNLEAYQHFFKGEENINKLEFKDAEEEFRKAVAIDPNFALAYWRMAYAISWSNFDRAQEPMRMALKNADKLPEKDRLSVFATKAYFEKNYDEASRQLDQFLKLYPEEKEALFTRGDWYYHFGEKEKAKDYFLRVLALDPNFERATQHLIWTYQASGEFEKAVKTAQEYAARAKTGDAIELFFQQLVSTGDYKGAEEVLNNVAKEHPDLSDLVLGRAEICRMRGEFEQSELECRKLLDSKRELSDQALGQGCLADVYADTGRFRKAIAAKQEQIALRKKANMISALSDDYAELAYLYIWGLNDRKQSEQAVEQSLQYAKQSDEVLHVLFETLNLLGRSEDALRVARENLWGHRPFTLEWVRAFRNIKSGNYPEAIKDLNIVAERGHTLDNAFARYHIASCYMALKQYDKALSILQSLNSWPGFRTFLEYPRFVYSTATAYELSGNKKAAQENYKKFLSLWKEADPDLPEVIEARKRIRS